MLKVRLQRVGKKKQAHYKLVVIEHTRKTTGKYRELLGWYNPHTNEVSVNEERLHYYLSNGAQMSPTVNNVLITKGIIKGEKVTSWKPKKKPKEAAKAEETKLKEEKLAQEAPKEEAAEVDKTE